MPTQLSIKDQWIWRDFNPRFRPGSYMSLMVDDLWFVDNSTTTLAADVGDF